MRKINTQVNIYLGNDQEAKDIFNQLNEYRKLEGQNWRSFWLLSGAGRVAKDNPELARRIIQYLTR